MNIVTPSSQIDSSLPLWIRSPDVIINGLTNQSYSRENHRNFVDFMTVSGESQERMGFGQNLMQNLLKYKDFSTYQREIIKFSLLKVQNSTTDKTLSISADETESLEIVDGNGFPERNGVVLIDDEVILYRRRVDNVLYDLRRGSSATSILPTFRSSGSYLHKTEPAEHFAGATVHNLSVLFMTAILDRIHKTYTHGIEADRVDKRVNRDSLLTYIKDFFQSKGSKLGIKALFKILFGENDVEVFYPGDRMINPSESTWVKSLIVRTVPMPKVFCDPEENYVLPDRTIGSVVEFRSYSGVIDDGKGNEVVLEKEDLYAKTYSDYNISYQHEDQTQYELYLSKSELQGKIIANPVTTLTRDLSRTTGGYVPDSTTVTVESTLGFPSKGVIFIDEEAIFYNRKTLNQFLDCHRGYIGVDKTHKSTTKVYGPYYIKTTITDKNGVEHVSRSWPLGLVESVSVEDGGLLHSVDDKVELDGPGLIDFREQGLATLNRGNNEEYTFLENYDDDLTTQTSSDPDLMAYVGDRTHGPDGVFFDDQNIFVSSSGFPEHKIGLFNKTSTPEDNRVGPLMVNDEVIAVFPRRDNLKLNLIDENKYVFDFKGSDRIGVFVDGVRAYSNVSPNKFIQGRIVRFDVIKRGFGYKNPTVVLVPSSYAEATVSESNGEILSVVPTVKTPETIYTDVPVARISSGEGAELKVSLDNYGRITSVKVTSPGQYYNDIPTLKILDPSGVGKGGLLSCQVLNGRIDSVNVESAGIDYQLGTEIQVIPVGSGAEIRAIVEYFDIDRYAEIDRTSDWNFDDGNGFLYEGLTGTDRKYYGYICSPTKLRERLDDDGTKHSKILGWAFDGNPIYGPYGYVNKKDDKDGIERQQSAYVKRNTRLNVIPNGGGTLAGAKPPSIVDYPMGYFTQDYRYDPVSFSPVQPGDTISGYLANEDPTFLHTDSVRPQFIDIITLGEEMVEIPTNVLDENNGKVCNTPDFPVELYPDGVYCYFTTIDENGAPAFPYIMGKTFHNRPVSQNLIIASQETITPLARQSIYHPLQVDDVQLEFDFKKVERLRNPYLQSTKEGVELRIGEVYEGSLSDVLVEEEPSAPAGVGDYVYFDNTNTTGAGAQALVSKIKGQQVVFAGGSEISTTITSHHMRLTLDSRGEFYTIADDSKMTSFDSESTANFTVLEYWGESAALDVNVTSTALVKDGHKSHDNKRRLFSINDARSLAETARKKELWFDDIAHFKVNDVVSIDGEEEVLIRSVNALTDQVVTSKNLLDRLDGGKAISVTDNELDGDGNFADHLDGGTATSDQIPKDNQMVSVVRGYGTEPKPVQDGVEVVNKSRYLYVIMTEKRHRLLGGDKITISGSKHEELNGDHVVVENNPYYIVLYVDKLYEPETTISYITSSEFAQGVVADVKLTSPGYGYSDLPVIKGIYKRYVDRAEVDINTNGREIGSVDVVYGGASYTNPEAIFICTENRGSGATADVEVEDGQITKITVTNPGSDYVSPVLYLVETTGKFISITDDIGRIKSVKVINPGRNISADRSLKPEILIDTRFVVDYVVNGGVDTLVVDGGTATVSPPDILNGGTNETNYPEFSLDLFEEVVPFKEGDLVYQGTYEHKYCSAKVTHYDKERQIISVDNIKGIFKQGEPIYSRSGTRAMLVVEGQADCRCVVNGSATPEGRFITKKSMPSEEYAVIQDSYRYQWFSYVISSPIQQVEYGQFVKDIIHPAGFIQFADLTIHDSIKFVDRNKLNDVVVEKAASISRALADNIVTTQTTVDMQRGSMAETGEEDLVQVFFDKCAPLRLLASDGTPILSSTPTGLKYTLVHTDPCVDGEPLTLT